MSTTTPDDEPTYDRCEYGHIEPDSATDFTGTRHCVIISPASPKATPFSGSCGGVVTAVPIDQAWYDAMAAEYGEDA